MLGSIATNLGLLVAMELAAVVLVVLGIATAVTANVGTRRRSATAPVPLS